MAELTQRIKVIEEELVPLRESIKTLEFTPEQEHTQKELKAILSRLGDLPVRSEEDILGFLDYIRELPVQTEKELNEFIESLKQFPRQREVDKLKRLVRALKNLPPQSKAELDVLVEHLKCFPAHTEEELIALVEHVKYLPKRSAEQSRAIIDCIERLPRHTEEESKALMREISFRKDFPKKIKIGLTLFIERISLITRLKLIYSLKDIEKEPQEELIFITELIKKQIPTCAMIFLFGSYAKGTEVRYDENYVNGVLTTYQSDFDIMVVTDILLSDQGVYSIERLLSETLTDEYEAKFAGRLYAPPQFIVDSIERLTRHLNRKQCFFTDVVTEGIVLYSSGECVLPEPQELLYREITEIAQGQFDQCIAYADGFLDDGYSNLKKNFYGMGAFLTHQACEKYYNAMGMVFDNFNPKLHDLKKLIAKTKGYSRDLSTVFPRNTTFEKRSFNLLYDAYTQARYDIHYVVVKEELEYMLARVEVLKEITYRLCKQRLSEYAQKMVEQEG